MSQQTSSSTSGQLVIEGDEGSRHPTESNLIRKLAGGLIFLSFAYVAYVVRVLWVYRFADIHKDFWMTYDRLLNQPFPANFLSTGNGHSIIVPSLIWIPHLFLTGGNETSLYLIALGLLLFTAYQFIGPVLRDAGLGVAEKAMLIVSALGALFWLAGVDILISAGFILMNIFPILALAGSARLLESENKSAMLWSGVLCACGTFSFGTGLALWPAVAIVAIFKGVHWRRIIPFLGAMVLAATMLLVVLPSIGPQGDIAAPSGRNFPFLATCRNWLVLLGAPVGHTVAELAGNNATILAPVSLAAGVVAVFLASASLALSWIHRPRLVFANVTGLLLLLFILGCTAMIAVARREFFQYRPQDPFSSRFLYWSVLFWMGVPWAFFRLLPGRQNVKPAIQVTAGVAMLLLLLPAAFYFSARPPIQRWSQQEFNLRRKQGVPGSMIFIPDEVVERLNAESRRRQMFFYANKFHLLIGKPFPRSMHQARNAEAVWLETRKSYDLGATKALKKFPNIAAARLHGHLSGAKADAILVTDQNEIVRGLGEMTGPWEPFSAKNRDRFVVFINNYRKPNQYKLWALRNGICTPLEVASKDISP